MIGQYLKMTLEVVSEPGQQIPNGHTTSNPRLFDVDITSIRRKPNFDEFPHHFLVLFRCNFADRKIHVVSTYLFRHNFDGRKIHLVSTHFFRCNFSVRKIHVDSPFKIDEISRTIHVEFLHRIDGESTEMCPFYPLHKYLDINPVTTAESSPLRVYWKMIKNFLSLIKM